MISGKTLLCVVVLCAAWHSPAVSQTKKQIEEVAATAAFIEADKERCAPVSARYKGRVAGFVAALSPAQKAVYEYEYEDTLDSEAWGAGGFFDAVLDVKRPADCSELAGRLERALSAAAK